MPNFSAGGIATPADAALMMQLGAEAVFVGSGIFKSADPAVRAKAIVQATTHYKDPDVLAKVSEGLGDAMPGIETSKLQGVRAAADPRLVGGRDCREQLPGEAQPKASRANTREKLRER